MSTTPVKVRGGGYGLDAELAKKAADKYDYEMEDEARGWIEEITGLQIGEDFGEGLRDGVILCELVNKIHPGIVKRIESKSKLAFKLMENVSAFLKACRTIGVNEFDLFETVDLFELKDLGLVVRCLHSLGRAVQKHYPNFNGPTLGVKESHRNERQFSDQQLTEARNTPALISYGSMRTMERLDVNRSNDVTFGAAAASGYRRPPPPPPPPSAEKIEMVSKARAAPPSPPQSAMQAPAESPSWQSSTNGWSSTNSWSNEAKTDQTTTASPVQSSAKNDSVAELSKSIESVSFQSSAAASPPSPQKTPVSSAPNSVSPQKRASSTASSPERRRSSGLAGLSSSNAAASDASAQEEAQEWIEAVLNERFLTNFSDSLKDGVILCQLMNAIKPNSITRIQTSQMPFKQMENITAFLKACRAIGVAEFDLFETVDLFEQKNIGLVVKCLHALGRTVQKNLPEFTGPTLGVKESTVNKRTFTDAQLKEAATAVPLLGQHGMGAERPHDFDRSASVTFGRDAAFSGLEKKPSSGDVTSSSNSPDARSTVTATYKTSGASDSAPSASPAPSPAPSPLLKSASKSSQLPTRTVWTS